jgi:hypothetical protein
MEFKDYLFENMEEDMIDSLRIVSNGKKPDSKMCDYLESKELITVEDSKCSLTDKGKKWLSNRVKN